MSTREAIQKARELSEHDPLEQWEADEIDAQLRLLVPLLLDVAEAAENLDDVINGLVYAVFNNGDFWATLQRLRAALSVFTEAMQEAAPRG